MVEVAGNNVKPLTNPEAAMIDDAKQWIRGMTDKGYYPGSTARFRISAIDNLEKVLGKDEPRSAQWFLAHLDEIAKRWATINSNPNTAATYESRARGGLDDYLQFLADPTAFKPRRRDVHGKEATPNRSADKAKASLPPEPPPVPVQRPTTTWRTFPIGNGESIEYRLPDGGVEVRDALKFAIHLATMAKDFNLADSVVAKIFALARIGDSDQP